MTLRANEFPLEIDDHVILDQDLVLGFGDSSVLPAGSHGMVRKVWPEVTVEFRFQMYRINHPMSKLTLFRRSWHSKRRAEHDKFRLEEKNAKDNRRASK